MQHMPALQIIDVQSTVTNRCTEFFHRLAGKETVKDFQTVSKLCKDNTPLLKPAQHFYISVLFCCSKHREH